MKRERVLDMIVTAAAVLVIPSVYLESEAHGAWRTFGSVLDWVIWTTFAVEFVVLLALSKQRLRWLRQHPLEVVIVFLTPPFAPATVQTLRVFRVLRVLRVMRIATSARRLFSLDGITYMAILTALAVVGGGDAFANAENLSAWDGLWWAITTTTTVGYGDIYPHTVLGRFIAMGLMAVGIGFVAIITGAVAQRFLAQESARVTEGAEAVERAEIDVLGELREVMLRIEKIENALRPTQAR